MAAYHQWEIQLAKGRGSREIGSGKNDGRRVWGSLHRPSLTIRQGLTAFEADLEPEGAVERARVLQHSHIQHRHLGHNLASGPQLQRRLLQRAATGEERLGKAEAQLLSLKSFSGPRAAFK